MSAGKLKAAIIGHLVGLAVIALAAGAALAADKGGPRVHDDIVPPKAEAWTGPSIAVGAGWAVGAVDFGGPFDFSANGPSVSGVVAYDKQWGSLVAGAGLGYTHYFGDLGNVINHDILGYGRLGFLVSSSTLVYGHLGYGRLDTDAGNINGFRFGPGVEFKMSDSPFSIDLRWTHAEHDVDKLAPNLNASSDEITGRLVYRFKP